MDWAAGRAVAAGFAAVTVACEPTGHRWRVLSRLAAERGMPMVRVQPSMTSWSWRAEDLTYDKTDEKDAVLIARLTAQLRCYIPEPVDETWGRLRHLGARREQLIVDMVSQIQQIRALLECVWPAALDTAAQTTVDRIRRSTSRLRKLRVPRYFLSWLVKLCPVRPLCHDPSGAAESSRGVWFVPVLVREGIV